jgi:hypothetical protein
MAAIAAGTAVSVPYIDALRTGSHVVWVIAGAATVATVLVASPLVVLWLRSSARPTSEDADRRLSRIVWATVILVSCIIIGYLAVAGELSPRP